MSEKTLPMNPSAPTRLCQDMRGWPIWSEVRQHTGKGAMVGRAGGRGTPAAAAHPMSPARGASYWLSTSSGTVKTCPGYMRSGSRINAELALKMTL